MSDRYDIIVRMMTRKKGPKSSEPLHMLNTSWRPIFFDTVGHLSRVVEWYSGIAKVSKKSETIILTIRWIIFIFLLLLGTFNQLQDRDWSTGRTSLFSRLELLKTRWVLMCSHQGEVGLFKIKHLLGCWVTHSAHLPRYVLWLIAWTTGNTFLWISVTFWDALNRWNKCNLKLPLGLKKLVWSWMLQGGSLVHAISLYHYRRFSYDPTMFLSP